eukprot:gnl/Spiro4/3481_TR1706_c0_g1_i1.p1 gnl/Spiro4/3481_TR1706_c0_g1~~gnl/Spiro4/3481_TR1706_c0_g1_i1.p1  ORF type:complete len:360 (+),score=89.20 gnl/Spiro4/3481_TR1706_c0_g1_i1:32-1081(+)
MQTRPDGFHHDTSFGSNPFAEDTNPFSDPSVIALQQRTPGELSGSSGFLGGPSSAASSFGGGAISSDTYAPPAAFGRMDGAGARGGGGGGRSQEELDRRWAELEKREAALASGGVVGGEPARPLNWPPLCPASMRWLNHDIETDVPQSMWTMVRVAHYCYWGAALCLFWNALTMLFDLLISTGASDVPRATSFTWSTIYAVTGIPLNWILWYRPLYVATGSKRKWKWYQFFIFFSIAGAFAILMTIGINTVYACGVLSTIQQFSSGSSKFVAICYAIGCCLWGAQSLFYLNVWWVVNRHYKQQQLADLQAEIAEAAAPTVIAGVAAGVQAGMHSQMQEMNERSQYRQVP